MTLLNGCDGVLRDLGWMNELTPALKLNVELMRRRAGEIWATASEIAGAPVRGRMAAAHQIIGILVRYCEERGSRPADVTPQLIDEAAIEYMGKQVGLCAESLQEAIDPTAAVGRRTLYGGPAPSGVASRLAEYEAKLAADQARREEAAQRIQLRLQVLERTIDALLT
jgi:argininosuccinate lyase